MNDFKKKISMGLTDHKKLQYTDFLDLWLERKKFKLKSQSYDRLVSTVEIHIKPILGFYFLDKLDSDTIQNDVINQKAKSMSFSSLKKIYDALNESFRFARRSGKITNNPMDLVEVPTALEKNQSKKSIEILSSDEIKKIVTVINSVYSNGSPVYRNGKMFLLMLNTGLRMGEACALRWDDYNEFDKTIRVCSTIIQKKDSTGKKVVEYQPNTKTKNSERVLKLNSNAIEALPNERTGAYIYCTKDGNPLRPRNVQNMLDSIVDKAGITEHKSTHILRHTFASHLFKKGYDVRLVSELLGYSNVNTTYNTYNHIIKQQKAKAMDSIEDILIPTVILSPLFTKRKVL